MDLGARVVRDLGAIPPFEADFAFGAISNACPPGFGDSSSFRSVTVAAVHVDVEISAPLTDSAFSCGEVMLMISRYNAL
jgi:hypothetical protein